MKKVLFVDDEPAVLEGLRMRLRRLRGDWDMVFAEGPAAGMAALERSEFDAVVSDMRMPGMDGVDFLKHVRRRQPPAVRVALSGQTRADALIPVLSVAHQFLAKPAGADQLTEALERAWKLQARIHNAAMTGALGNLETLPAAPETFRLVSAALESSDVELRELAGMISRDVAISAKILQVLNSPYFGLQRQVVDIREAVAYLGVDCTRSLLLNFGIQGVLEPYGLPAGFSLDAFQHHSFLTARIAGRLLPEGPESKVAISAAILHDIGRLALATLMPTGYQRVLEHAVSATVPEWWAEEAVLGFSHAEVGGYLLAVWGLPFPVVEAVAGHHRSDRGAGRLTASGAVYLATRLAHELEGHRTGEEWDEAYLREIGWEGRIAPFLESLAGDTGAGNGKEGIHEG